MCVPEFRSIGPKVRPVERKQTHTDATENITSSANAGGKNLGITSKYFVIETSLINQQSLYC